MRIKILLGFTICLAALSAVYPNVDPSEEESTLPPTETPGPSNGVSCLCRMWSCANNNWSAGNGWVVIINSQVSNCSGLNGVYGLSDCFFFDETTQDTSGYQVRDRSGNFRPVSDLVEVPIPTGEPPAVVKPPPVKTLE